MYLWRTIRYFLLILLLLSGLAFADTAAFDLPGPQINIRVTRDSKTLPISQVPNLQPGDRLWLHPNLPPDQSAHYLLIVAFLRGSTNPPPEAWFTKVETWRKPAREEGSSSRFRRMRSRSCYFSRQKQAVTSAAYEQPYEADLAPSSERHRT
jgi:hypothetical protein